MSLIVLPAISPTGVLRYDWVDPQGVVRDLTWETSPSLYVPKGAAGLGSPGVEPSLEKLPFSAGSLLRYVQTRHLEISLPIHAYATTFAGLLTLVGSLRAMFDTANETTRTPGYLRITRPQDDAVRQIACYYVGGLEGSLKEGSPTWAPLVVSLVAPDPYWTDVDETIEIYDSGDVGTTLSVINYGDFDAYPIWTIQGPASGIQIANSTSGKTLALTAGGGLTLAAGETLTIDTRPASQRTTLQVIDQDGASYFSKLSAGSALWWLPPGQSFFTITASGMSGATGFELSWLPRYRGVLR